MCASADDIEGDPDQPDAVQACEAGRLHVRPVLLSWPSGQCLGEVQNGFDSEEVDY